MVHFSARHRFSDWPNPTIPPTAAGVYLVWEGERLIYCGMSGRGIEKESAARKRGLVTRLASHASGRLSGDQFCVYVANRIIIPSLSSEQLSRFATGELTLDALTRAYIAERLEYQFTVVGNSSEAFELERSYRAGARGLKPLLNPA